MKYSIASRIKRLLKSILLRGVENFSTATLESLILQLVSRRVAALPAREALRFLFRLDSKFYSLRGEKSVEYDGGVHTKHRHMAYHNFFVSRVRPGERVLDVGCGIGAVAYHIAEKAKANVVGIDINPDNISLARQRYSHPRVHTALVTRGKKLLRAPLTLLFFLIYWSIFHNGQSFCVIYKKWHDHLAF